MEICNETLLQRARAGDESALGELIRAFYERIYAFLRRLTGHDADAEDLTQRAFGRFCQAVPTFAGRSSLSSWLHSIAYHGYVDWRRRNHRSEDRDERWWSTQVCGQPKPDEAASANDAAQRLFAAVDRLESELRDTVHLHYYQDLTLEETAEAMGVATSTVKYRLRQAMQELRDAFDDGAKHVLTRVPHLNQ